MNVSVAIKVQGYKVEWLERGITFILLVLELLHRCQFDSMLLFLLRGTVARAAGNDKEAKGDVRSPTKSWTKLTSPLRQHMHRETAHATTYVPSLVKMLLLVILDFIHIKLLLHGLFEHFRVRVKAPFAVIWSVDRHLGNSPQDSFMKGTEK